MLKLCWSRPTAGGELVGRWVEVSPIERPSPEPRHSPVRESLLPGRVRHSLSGPDACGDACFLVGASSNGAGAIAKLMG
jgi:hypothetical protein